MNIDDGKKYYIKAQDDDQLGPVTGFMLKQLAWSNEIDRDYLILADGEITWKSAQDCDGLKRGRAEPPLAADPAGHHLVTTTGGNPAVPDRCVGAVAGPCLVEIGMRAVGQLLKASAVDIDGADGRLPFAHIRITFHPTEKHQLVSGLRPRRLEVPMPGGDRLSFRCAENVDVDFSILVVGGPITFIGD